MRHTGLENLSADELLAEHRRAYSDLTTSDLEVALAEKLGGLHDESEELGKWKDAANDMTPDEVGALTKSIYDSPFSAEQVVEIIGLLAEGNITEVDELRDLLTAAATLNQLAITAPTPSKEKSK